MEQRYLQKEEDQSVSIQIGNRTYRFHFFPFRNLMYMDVSYRREMIIAGKRVLPNQWLLPNYIAEGRGNLRFETYKADGNDYVWWEEFNDKFRLMLYKDAEIKSLEVGNGM